MSTAAMIKRLNETRGLPGGVPFLLSNIYGVAAMESALHEAGIKWRSVGEGLDQSLSFKQAQKAGLTTRWVLFVRRADLDAATQVAHRLPLRQASDFPVRYTSRALCKRHDYELEPCSGCSTGFDWWGKADEAEKEEPPFRRPSPL